MKLPDNVQEVIEGIYADVNLETGGKICRYIPELANFTGEQENMFGIVICDLEGNMYKVGDTAEVHTIQSTSKVLLFCLALMEKGKREVTKFIGTEPTGKPFDEPSINLDKKQVFNPYVNAGGITSAGLVSGSARERYEKFEGLAKLMSESRKGGSSLCMNERVYQSEMKTNSQ